MRIQRLNLDNSWLINWDGVSFLLDPWLSGPEIDGFAAFNIQWHATDALPYEQLDSFSHVLVSQPYADHCHQETLQKLPGEFNVFAVKQASSKLKKWLPSKSISLIPDISDGFIKIGNLDLAKISPNRLIDPIYHALVIKNGKRYIFYAPHGFTITAEQHAFLKELSCTLLITTYTHFTLPLLLGGVINPGLENASELADLLKPDYVVNSHDEQKIAKGLVMKLAKVRYAEWKDMELLQTKSKLLQMDNYEPLVLQ